MLLPIAVKVGARHLWAKRSLESGRSRTVENGRTAGVISRQQRDVNRLPDPVLKITAVASSGLLADRGHLVQPNSA